MQLLGVRLGHEKFQGMVWKNGRIVVDLVPCVSDGPWYSLTVAGTEETVGDLKFGACDVPHTYDIFVRLASFNQIYHRDQQKGQAIHCIHFSAFRTDIS